MICPKCKQSGAKYIVKKRRTGTAPHKVWAKREDFRAIHKNCGWEGEI